MSTTLTMSRADRRRKQKAAPVVKPDAPLIDFIVWTGDGFDPTACLASLPASGVTAATCGKSDGSPYAARNKLALRGRAPFIAFLDADCIIETDGLRYAMAALHEGVAVVGGLVMRGERVFHAGYAFNVEGRPYFRFADWKADAAKVMVRRDVQAVPFTFMLTRRDVFRVTRFREEYGEMAYGDADYCLRAKGGVVYEPGLRAVTTGAMLLKPSDAAVMALRSCEVRYDEMELLA